MLFVTDTDKSEPGDEEDWSDWWSPSLTHMGRKCVVAVTHFNTEFSSVQFLVLVFTHHRGGGVNKTHIVCVCFNWTLEHVRSDGRTS